MVSPRTQHVMLTWYFRILLLPFIVPLFLTYVVIKYTGVNPEAQFNYKIFFNPTEDGLSVRNPVGGVEVTETVYPKRRRGEDTPTETVYNITAIDDETDRVRTFTRSVPYNPSTHRTYRESFCDWEEFEEQRPNVACLLTSPLASPVSSLPSTPSSTPASSPVHSRPPSPSSTTFTTSRMADTPDLTAATTELPQQADVHDDAATDLRAPTPVTNIPDLPLSYEHVRVDAHGNVSVTTGDGNTFLRSDSSIATQIAAEIRAMASIPQVHVHQQVPNEPPASDDLPDIEPGNVCTTATHQRWFGVFYILPLTCRNICHTYRHTNHIQVWSEQQVEDLWSLITSFNSHNFAASQWVHDWQHFNYLLEAVLIDSSTRRTLHLNITSLKDFKAQLGKLLDKYDLDEDGLMYDHVFTRWTHENHNEVTQHIPLAAGMSEAGIERVATTCVYSIDILKSKTTCLPNAFALHHIVSTKDLNTVDLRTIQRDVIAYRDALVCVKKTRREWSTCDYPLFATAFGLPSRRVILYHPSNPSHIEKLRGLAPADFLGDNIRLMYHKNHASLLLHAHNISAHFITGLKHYSRYTSLSLIRKPVRMKPKEYHDLYTMSVECDTISGTHIPRLLTFTHHDANSTLTFPGASCVDNFMQHILQTHMDISCYTHSGGKYDFKFFFMHMHKYLDKALDNPIEVLSSNGSFIQLVMHLSNNCKLILRDSHKLLQQDMSDLAKSFGAYDTSHTQQRQATLGDILRSYEKHTLMRYGMNPLNHLSASALAKNMFFEKYYDHTITPLYLLSQHTDEYIREGYKAAMTVAYNVGSFTGKYYHYDFDSLYPSCAMEELPYDRPKYMCPPSSTDPKEYLREHPGIYTIRATSPQGMKYHLLGTRADGRVTYTHMQDQLLRAVPYQLILYSIEIGYEVKIVDGYSFRYSAYMSDMMKDIYKDKACAPDLTHRAISKQLLNSTYGGFATVTQDVEQLVCKAGRSYRDYLNKAFISQVRNTVDSGNMIYGTDIIDREPYRVNVAVASTITALAQVKLHKQIMRVHNSGYNVLYVDTDSLITDVPIDTTTTGIGTLRDELKSRQGDNYITSLSIAATKTYTYRTHHEMDKTQSDLVTKMRGMRREGQSTIEEDIQALATGAHVRRYQQTRTYGSVTRMLRNITTPVVTQIVNMTLRSTAM